MAMSYKQIETSREIRQWIKLLVSAGAVGVSMSINYATNPEFKKFVDGLGLGLKFKISQKIKNL